MATLLRMPKPETREQEESDLAAYTARWLQLADAALSAIEKAAKALEIALAKSKSISAATLNASSKLKRRKAKKVG